MTEATPTPRPEIPLETAYPGPRRVPGGDTKLVPGSPDPVGVTYFGEPVPESILRKEPRERDRAAAYFFLTRMKAAEGTSERIANKLGFVAGICLGRISREAVAKHFAMDELASETGMGSAFWLRGAYDELAARPLNRISDRDLREMLQMAIGQASMCWEPRPEGVFDSSAAVAVADELLARLGVKQAEDACVVDPASGADEAPGEAGGIPGPRPVQDAPQPSHPYPGSSVGGSKIPGPAAEEGITFEAFEFARENYGVGLGELARATDRLISKWRAARPDLLQMLEARDRHIAKLETLLRDSAQLRAKSEEGLAKNPA